MASPTVKKAIRSSSANAPRTTRSSPASPTPSSPRIALASCVVELGQLGLEARRDRHRAGALRRRRARRSPPAPRRTPSSTLATNSTGLAVSGAESRAARRRPRRAAARVRAGRPAGERLDQLARARPARRSRRGRRRARRARRARGAARPARGRRASARSRSSRCRRAGRRAPRDARRSVVVVRAHDVEDRVGLADVGEEAVAQSLAAVGAGDQAGDVVEGDRVVDDLAARTVSATAVEALVDHRHDGDVGLDRGERIVGGLGPGRASAR